jgi:hypothetical protein
MKTPVIRKKDYTLYFQLYEGYTFVHMDCYRWSKTVKENFIKDVDTLCTLHPQPVYALHDIGDIKHLKFIEMFKFKYLMDVLCTDGVTRQVFERKE